MVNIQEAKTHLSRLLEKVVGGEEVVIAKAGKPVARLVPYREVRPQRTLGRLAENYFESADCWSPESEFDESLENPSLYHPDPSLSSGVVVAGDDS